jgi:hypothetical protein
VFLAEGLALGALGSAAGTGLGAALAKGALLLVGGTATQLYIRRRTPRCTSILSC